MVFKVRLKRFKFMLIGPSGKVNRRILFCAAAGLVLLLVIIFAKPEKSMINTAEISIIKDRGVLNVGVYDGMPGFSNAGEGLEIDLGTLLAKRILGEEFKEKSVKFITVDSRTAQFKLDDGSVDVVIALRKPVADSSQYLYSSPYYTDKCLLAVLTGNSQADLTGSKIGYVRTSYTASILKNQIASGKLSAEAVAYPSYPDMLQALQNQSIAAAAMQNAYIIRYAAEYQLETHGTELGTVEYAVMCSNDSPAFVQIADLLIRELKESGKLAALCAEYSLPVYE